MENRKETTTEEKKLVIKLSNEVPIEAARGFLVSDHVISIPVAWRPRVIDTDDTMVAMPLVYINIQGRSYRRINDTGSQHV
ncbi:hypothetical protein TNCV_1352391 [Trichonephila clavipes]|nr:hypothetical protein TNCV_1352391 [Trichonephila clavipes]